MLLLKLWRDLLKNKIQFLAIFLMSFMGLYVFAGIDGEASGMARSANRYYAAQNLADLWIAGRDFTPEDERLIESVEGISGAERRITMEGKVDNADEDSMELIFIESNEISRMDLKEGTAYQSGKAGAWLDASYAEPNGYQVGDIINLKTDDTTFSVQIMGLVKEPEHVYYLPDAAAMMPAYGEYGFCIMDVSECPEEGKAFNQVIADCDAIDNKDGVSGEEKAVVVTLGNKIREILDQDTLVVTGKDDNLSYQTFQSEIDQHRTMAWMFPIVFVLISILGIITTMTRLMAKQRIQIGTMKALGFSAAAITLHYVSYGFLLSLTGAVLGAIVGYMTIADLILSMMYMTYQVPGLSKVFTSTALLMIALMVAASTLISWYACRKEGKLPPAETLKPAPPKNQKHFAIEKTKLWLQLDFSTQWNIRDILRNLVRTLMGMFGVVGCSMLLLSAFGCLDTVHFITGWSYGQLNTASNRIVMASDTPYSVTRDYAKQYSGQMVETGSIILEARTPEGESVTKTGTLTVLDQGNYMHYQDGNLHHIDLKKDEIAITYKMAHLLGVESGDMVTWHIVGDDTFQTTRVGQIYRNPSSQGLTMYRETFEHLDYKFVPTEILTNHSVPASLSDKEAVTGVQNTSEMMKSLDSMMEMMYMMVGILVVAAVGLGVIVLYNLGVLSMVEKMREMATLKVLGFSTKRIRGILQQQNIWVTALGIVLGFPAGYGILYGLFNAMPESMDYTVVVNPMSYIYTVAGTFLVSLLVNRVLSRDVKKIDMVDALKGQE